MTFVVWFESGALTDGCKLEYEPIQTLSCCIWKDRQTSLGRAVWPRAIIGGSPTRIECFCNQAVLFNTPPVVIPPRARGKWKRRCYFLLWAVSPGLTLYSCVPGYKAPLYNTDVIMGHFLTGSQTTEMKPNRTFFGASLITSSAFYLQTVLIL